MKIRVQYTVSHDVVLDMTPEGYLRARADFEVVRKKVGAPPFRTNINSFEPRGVDDEYELMDYWSNKK